MATVGVFSKNVVTTAAVRVVGLITSLGISVLIARVLGPEGRGLYALAILLPSVIVVFTNLGIGPATVYYVARGAYARTDILGSTIWLSLTISALSIAIGLVVVFFLREWILPGVSQGYLLLALTLIPFALLTSYLRQILLGLQYLSVFNIIALAQGILSLTLMVVVVWGFQVGVPGAIAVRVLMSLIPAVGTFFLIRCILGGVIWRPNHSYLKAATTFGVQAHLANMLQFFNYRLDVVLINGFLSPVSVGSYSVAVAVAERLWLLSHAASTVLYPRVAAETDERARRRFTPIISRNVLWITVMGAGIVYGLSLWVIVALYSSDYLPAVRPLQILLPGIVALGTARVLTNDLAGRGRPILNSYLSGIALIVNAGLNLILIPRYGINGAAWATTASYTVHWGLAVLLYSYISGSSPWSVLIPQRSDLVLWRVMIRSLALSARHKIASLQVTP